MLHAIAVDDDVLERLTAGRPPGEEHNDVLRRLLGLPKGTDQPSRQDEARAFGVRMRAARTQQRRSLSVLARACSVNTQYLSEIERGRRVPANEDRLRIARVLSIE